MSRRISMKAPLTASTGPRSTDGARYCASAPGARALRPGPVKCASAPSGVGNDRRAAWSKLPSSSSSRHPQIPIAGSAPAAWPTRT